MRLTLVTLGCLGTTLLGCAPASGASDTLTIGLVIPYTGPRAQRGINLERSMLMSADAINRAGGVAGRSVAFKVVDTHSAVYTGLQAAQELFSNDEVVAVIGPEDGALGELLAPHAKARDKLLVEPSPTLTTVNLAASQRTHWVRLNPSITPLARRLADQIIADDRQKILIAYVIDSFGTASNDRLVGYIVQDQRDVNSTAIQAGAKDGSSAVVSALLAAGTNPYDAIVVATYASQAAAIVNETTFRSPAAQQGKIGWYFANVVRGPEFTNHVVPRYVEGATGVRAGYSEHAPEFVTAFEERWFGEQPTDDAYYYVDALNLLALGIEATGVDENGRVGGQALLGQLRTLTTLSGRNIRWNQMDDGLEALRQGQPLTYEGLTGSLALLPDDPQRATVTAATWTLQNGEYVDN